jgi:hypothetical protein
VEGADKRTVDAIVEATVCLGRHAGVEEHQTAVAAGMGPRWIPVAIAMRDDDELTRAAQIARGERLFRLCRVVVVEGRDTVAAVRCNGANRSTSFRW